MSETFSESLRRRVREQAGTCPTCHQPTNEGGVRGLADQIGVSHTTLWRFLRGGDANTRTIDTIVKWLDDAQSKETPDA